MKTILVVDDERLVVTLVGTILEKYGYRVLTATDGLDAARVSDLNRGGIDLLITNHCLKSENGKEVADILQSSQPRMKTLQISGYPESFLSHDGTKVPGGEFLQKPFLPAQLLQKVSDLLDP